MYISLFSLAFVVLFILGVVALVILIMVLIKLFSFLTRVNGLMARNEKNIQATLVSLPKATENFLDLSDDLKAVGQVLTETTATVIETKEHIEDYTDIFMDLIKIVRTVFNKKK